LTITSAVLPQIPESTLNHTDLGTLSAVLKDQFAQRHDHTVGRSTLRVNPAGNLEFVTLDDIQLSRPIITEDGVMSQFNPSGAYLISANAEAQIATMFKIPLDYLRRCKTLDPAFYAAQVNEWAKAAEGRNLLRMVYGQVPDHPEVIGVVRAVLSDKFKIMDNFDVVSDVFEAMGEVADELGISIGPDNIRALNLTENRLYIDIDVPEIAVNGRALVADYVSPYSRLSGAELPLINAGIRFTNSEVGKGRLRATPHCTMQVCGNGMQMNSMEFARTHLGAQLDEGYIQASNETVSANAELIKSQLKDAVRTYLSEDFVNSVVDKLEADAGVAVTKPETTIKAVAKEMRYTEAQGDAILERFMQGRQFTSGGVYNAITAAAKDLNATDPDAEFELAGSAPQAMKVAARLAQ